MDAPPGLPAALAAMPIQPMPSADAPRSAVSPFGSMSGPLSFEAPGPPPRSGSPAVTPGSPPSGARPVGRSVPTRTRPPRRPGLGAPLDHAPSAAAPEPATGPGADEPVPPGAVTPSAAVSGVAGPSGTAPGPQPGGPPVSGTSAAPVTPADATPVSRATGTPRVRPRAGLGRPLTQAPAERAAAGEPAQVARTTGSVPADLAQQVRAAYGADVSATRVHRHPEAAQDRQARGFTSGDEVTVAEPDRALLAHELVHVVQQRELGPAVPEESTPAGQALEADARAAEEAVREGRPLPPLRHRSPEQRPDHPQSTAGGTGRVQRAPLVHQHVAPPPATPSPPPPPEAPHHHHHLAPPVVDQRGTDQPTNWHDFGKLMANSATGLVLDQWGIADPAQDQRPNPGHGGRSAQQPDPGTGEPLDRHGRFQRLGQGLEDDLAGLVGDSFGLDLPGTRHDADTNGGSNFAPGGGHSGSAGHGDHAGSAPHSGASGDPGDSTGGHAHDVEDLDLDELAGRLYDRLRSRLRMELLLDRERAGLLTDFR